MSDVYIENGYENRKDYLKCLAEDHGIDEKTIEMMSELLGEDEDFDGLVSFCEDYDEDF